MEILRNPVNFLYVPRVRLTHNATAEDIEEIQDLQTYLEDENYYQENWGFEEMIQDYMKKQGLLDNPQQV